MKVIILGAAGNLGHELVGVFRAHDHEVIEVEKETLDIAKRDAAHQFVLANKPDAIVNAVAYNDVDGAEMAENKVLAQTLNVTVPRLWADVAREQRVPFVHYSTDYVFDGARSAGYDEQAAPNPLSYYAQTKVDGERAVAEVGGMWYLCRTSKLYGPPGTSTHSKPSFVYAMIRLAKEKPELSIIDDEAACPTYTKDVAEATVALLQGGYEPGIYHLINEGPAVTWYEFCNEIFDVARITTPRHPVTAATFPRLASRPQKVLLLNTKFPPLRPRRVALASFFDDYPNLL